MAKRERTISPKDSSVRVQQYTIRTHTLYPAQEIDKPLVVISAGWRMPLNRSRPIAQEIAGLGRRVAVFDHSDIPSYRQDIKAQALRDIIQSSETSKVDLVGYCEGAIPAAIAAGQSLDKVRTLTLFNPAGVIENDPKYRVPTLFAKKIARDWLLRDRKPGQPKQKYTMDAFNSNRLRAAREAISPLPNIINSLELAEQHGIPVGIIQSNNDTIYPSNSIASSVASQEFSSYTSLAEKNAAHSIFSTNPSLAARVIFATIEQNSPK